ncbi:hypothetical protein A3A59_01435 [Candidatus Gottesmanbacteria bacterium RIFCSPLOWO2_01_FULL_42_10]|nr:MAG: hypothetical protein A3A59_01435 [Candidatus Gottesmanbacteria bacterium RIFCSPLOWO2_01_FULL_42_10]
MSLESLFRVATGWIEKTMVGGQQYQRGIEGHVIVQKGGAKPLTEAIKEAKDVGGWVEQDGVPAHRPTGPVKRPRQ